MPLPSALPDLAISGAVARVSLRRPAAANRLGPDDLDRLAEHLGAVNAREDVRVLVIEASGRHFCAGFDLGRFAPETPARFAKVVDALEAVRPVTIAVLQGGVYGGGTDLALACDFRVGSDAVEMFMPAARLGLHYYASGLRRFVSRLGVDAAKRLFLAGERLDAAAMAAIGYLTHRCPADTLASTAARLAADCAAMAPLPLHGMKRHLNAIAAGGADAALLASIDAEVRRSLQSDDLREGLAAWREKRPPVFTGR